MFLFITKANRHQLDNRISFHSSPPKNVDGILMVPSCYLLLWQVGNKILISLRVSPPLLLLFPTSGFICFSATNQAIWLILKASDWLSVEKECTSRTVIFLKTISPEGSVGQQEHSLSNCGRTDWHHRRCLFGHLGHDKAGSFCFSLTKVFLSPQLGLKRGGGCLSLFPFLLVGVRNWDVLPLPQKGLAHSWVYLGAV